MYVALIIFIHNKDPDYSRFHIFVAFLVCIWSVVGWGYNE